MRRRDANTLVRVEVMVQLCACPVARRRLQRPGRKEQAGVCNSSKPAKSRKLYFSPGQGFQLGTFYYHHAPRYRGPRYMVPNLCVLIVACYRLRFPRGFSKLSVGKTILFSQVMLNVTSSTALLRIDRDDATRVSNTNYPITIFIIPRIKQFP